VTTKGVFSWQEQMIESWAKYIRLSPLDDDLSLFEIGLRDVNNEFLPASAEAAPELTDEQWMVPVQATYMNSTYFDEIYHARLKYMKIPIRLWARPLLP